MRYAKMVKEWQTKQDQAAQPNLRETTSEFRKQIRIKKKLFKEYCNGIWAKQPKRIGKIPDQISQFDSIIQSLKKSKE